MSPRTGGALQSDVPPRRWCAIACVRGNGKKLRAIAAREVRKCFVRGD
jgi:hypothetical protein